MTTRVLVLSCTWIAAATCTSPQTGARRAGEHTAAVRQLLEMRYAHQADAYRRRDADAFLENLEPDFTAIPLRGQPVSKAQATPAIRRRIETVESPRITVVIDSLQVIGDTADVYNTQRFLRVTRDSAGMAYEVTSTQQHFERWRRTARGWRIFYLRELGGSQQVERVTP
jgi:ketosteroid isomerase-like protein